MISSAETTSQLSVTLPKVTAQIGNVHTELWTELSPAVAESAECCAVDEFRGKVRSARLRLPGYVVDVSLARSYSPMGGEREIHAPHASVVNGVLDLGPDPKWKVHPLITEAIQVGYAAKVTSTWSDSPILRGERSAGEVVTPGFRAPQLGALHALAAHWSVRSTHAKVVLPTGTGKTDVMIAAALMKKARRVLVIVPSDALRTQILGKFATLGILRVAAVADENALNPVVAKIIKAPNAIGDIESLRRANVVGTTTQMLLGMRDELLTEFMEWFDLIYFDEAHHLPAASWQRIQQKIPAHTPVVSLTATPYRNDGKRVPGELVYQFPLRLAQLHGYFRPISVARVEEYDSSRSDEVIARRAIHALRADEAQGYPHIVFARAKTMDHADELQALYQRIAPDLNPMALHSRVSPRDKPSIISALTGGACRIVVCVDMLGEGFDLPLLKIAALHDTHKSLPVALQFIGRFTRSASHVGDATVVINMAEPLAQNAVSELFADDADWNELIPELSAQAVRSEEDMSAFVEGMRVLSVAEDRKFDLSLVRPKTSLTIFRASGLHPGRLALGLPKGTTIHQSWLSDDRNLLVFISQDRVYPDWSASKEAASLEWRLGVAAYDEENRLLYLNSTYSGVRLSAIARAIGGGDDVVTLSGERMFRVFDGVHRAVLHNVGLYRRGGGLRFQMLAGMDIGEFVTNAVQAGSSKSNLFAIGYEEGRKANVGASAKGRVWAMSPSSIPDWHVWAKRVAAKVLDDTIQTDSFLKFALIPTEIEERPSIDVFACVPPDELLPCDSNGEKKISVYGLSTAFNQLDLTLDVGVVNGDRVEIHVNLQEAEAEFELTWAGGFRVRHTSGPRIRILEDGEQVSLEDFLMVHPPVLLLVDGSEIVGRHHFRLPSALPYTFDAGSVLGIDWGSTPITRESKWKNGEQRPESVQGFMIDKCLADEHTFVIDDDDTGEVADIVVIDDKKDARELEVSLYHCKYSAGAEPGARFKDLYEVCGQAVKSARMLNRPEALVAHLIARESRLGGRPTRFERGNVQDLRALQRRIGTYRMRLNIFVVQPGLSSAGLTAELSTVLSAADGFVLEFTGRRLRVIGSI